MECDDEVIHSRALVADLLKQGVVVNAVHGGLVADAFHAGISPHNDPHPKLWQF